jgi:signal transduction histidine kinase
LRQVLHNLLRNAEEAHAAANLQTPLCISLSTCNEAREHAAGVLLRLRDNGPGIDEALLEDVFQPYVSSKQRSSRGEAASRTAGLGLAIVRKIIDESGGNIRLANHADGGAEASIWLPLAGTGASGV